MTSKSLLEPFVHNLGRQYPLTNDDKDAIFGIDAETHKYKSNNFLIKEYRPNDYCLILSSGYACSIKITSSGSRQIISIYLPGDGINLQNLLIDQLDYSVMSLSDVEVMAIRREDLLRLKHRHPSVERALDLQFVRETSIHREWLLSVSRREALARLAHLLCELSVRVRAAGLADQYGDGLPLTQQVMADCVGLTTVHLNRVYRRLEKDGLIERIGKKLKLPRWEELRAVADFDSRYLHLTAKTLPQAA